MNQTYTEILSQQSLLGCSIDTPFPQPPLPHCINAVGRGGCGKGVHIDAVTTIYADTISDHINILREIEVVETHSRFFLLGHHLRRWPNNKPNLSKIAVFCTTQPCPRW